MIVLILLSDRCPPLRVLSSLTDCCSPLRLTAVLLSDCCLSQSIGGAVSTGTHGASLDWASLSNQVLALTMVMADGALRTFTPKDGFLMRAVRLSVGQLGVITRLRLR